MSEGIFPEQIPTTVDTTAGVELRSRDGRQFRALARHAEFGTGHARRYVIQVALDRAQEEEVLARYRAQLLIVLGVAVGTCAAGGFWIARAGMAPVRHIAGTAREIRASTLHRRLKTDGLAAELADLATTFNNMLDGLQSSFERISRFSADLAHELRTPLNNLRGEVEVALGRSRSNEEYREVLGSCLEECQQLSRVIESLLFLARAENPISSIACEAFNLGQELQRIAEFYEVAATDAGLAVIVEARNCDDVWLDRMLLQRAVGNLLSNAIAHTPPGGAIRIIASDSGDGVTIAVEDTGCGIPSEHLPHVFERLYRVEQSRNSSSGNVGLGLSIVKSIVELHGGSVEIASRVQSGTSVLLQFPDSHPRSNLNAPSCKATRVS